MSTRFDSWRWTKRFAITVWVSAFVWILIFASFWRMHYLTPHAAWAVGSIVTTLGAALALVALCLWQLVRGPHRLIAVPIAILGLTPIVWTTQYLLDFKYRGEHRLIVNQTVPIRILTAWSSSLFDLAGKWGYPRWTSGRYALLLDGGQPADVGKLVEQMDQHIVAMATLLGESPPTGLRWVRGEIFRHGGFSSLNWAVCGANHDGELNELERHEMAHAVIDSLCGPDHDPSTLLVEGWAESQAGNRASQIQLLAKVLESGRHYSLTDFISPEYYNRNIGPNYGHGGPFVAFLIERYGGPKFFELYDNVRPVSFSGDVERVLGDPLPLIEKNFWDWIIKEDRRLRNSDAKNAEVKSEQPGTIELSDAVDKANWQTILDGVAKSSVEPADAPEHFAFSTERVVQPAKDNSPQHPDVRWWQSCVVDGHNVWIVEQREEMQYHVATENLLADISMKSSGGLYDTITSSNEILTDARRAWHNVTSDALRNLLDVAHMAPGTIVRVERVIRPKAGASIWEVDFEIRTQELRYTQYLEVDAASDWQTRHARGAFDDGTHDESTVKWGSLFGRSVPITATIDNRSEVDRTIGTEYYKVEELTITQAQAIRDEVETAVRKLRGGSWKEWLLRPGTLAIAWPATGLLMLCLGQFLAHRREGQQ
jgi:hypothetical protein